MREVEKLLKATAGEVGEKVGKMRNCLATALVCARAMGECG